jgi:autotransporter passenger strand-loop-strand repeat protein
LSGGYLLYFGGTVTGAKISSGGTEIIDQAAVSGLSVGNGIALQLLNGASASALTVTGGGGVLVGGTGVTIGASLKGSTVSGVALKAQEVLSGGGLASKTTIGSGGILVLSGGGAIGTTVSVGGTLRVMSGASASGTALSGGTEIVSSGGSIGGAVSFHGTGGKLSVAGTKGIALTVSGFAGTDTVDLADFASTGAKLSFVENTAKTSGTLTITDGTLKATVTLFGQYVATGFKLGADGAGGTAITYTSATAAHTDIVAHHT